MMKRNRTRAKVVYAITILLWLVACAAFTLPGMARYVTDKPWGDAYFTYTWSFQLTMFAIFRLPLWLGGLAIIILIERRLLSRPQTPS
jgi:hypothetical protein